MPETAVDKDYRSQSREYQVRTPWEAGDVEAETETQGMRCPSNGDLRLCIYATNRRHALGALSGGQYVCHDCTLRLNGVDSVC
jgi:hypothetical protein